MIIYHLETLVDLPSIEEQESKIIPFLVLLK